MPKRSRLPTDMPAVAARDARMARERRWRSASLRRQWAWWGATL